jgi:hypothetical protein
LCCHSHHHHHHHHHHHWLNHTSQHLSTGKPPIADCQWDEIHPIPWDQGACPRNLPTIWYVCKSTVFCPTHKMFLVKLLFSRYKRKVLVTTLSAEMTKRYTDMLLIFQIFLISRPIFHILQFLCFSLWKVMGQGDWYTHYNYYYYYYCYYFRFILTLQ